MFNQATLIGNMGADPEQRHTQAGKLVVSFTLATSEKWKDKNGEKRERTEWHRVVCFNEALSKVISQYCKKGSKILIEGKIQTRKWQDKDGKDRYTTEIVLSDFDSKLLMLDTKSSAPPPAASPDEYGKTTSYQPGAVAGDTPGFNDDIPF